MRPYQAFHVLEDLRNYSSIPLSRGGVGLSVDDQRTTLDVYQQWLLLCVDLGYLQPETLERDARRLWLDITKADVLDVNNAFAECLQSVRLQSARGFKALCQPISVHLYNHIKCDVARMAEGHGPSAKRLVQLFSYTSRLSLKDIDLTQQMLDAYLATEDSIPESYPDSIVHSLNNIIRRWIGPFLPEEVVPRHGPGGVAKFGRCDLMTKYKSLATDQLLEYAFGRPWWVDADVPPKLDRTSTTIFVPKSYKTFRTISMEPATLQYFQQGVWRIIDNLVAKHRYLRNHIGFHDAARNRDLARQGSVTRGYATIDLSSASDSVGYSLVKNLFSGTWLLRFIVATRSTHTLLPDGRRILLKKFAPMGSSLCFPIETLIFASVCEHVTRVHHVPGDYSVYGDDIIVPTQCVDAVCRILAHLGFVINHDKSYADSNCWFRESCGGEYCDGFDVTPMRVSRKYAHRDDYVRAMKWYSMANTAYLYEFRNLRYFFLKKIFDAGIVPLFSPTSIMSDNYSNYQAPVRWRRDYQRFEVKVTTFSAKHVGEHDESIEHIRYRHWLESNYLRRVVVDPFISHVTRSLMISQRAWCSKPEYVLDQDISELVPGTR